jgi:hypothetical protein
MTPDHRAYAAVPVRRIATRRDPMRASTCSSWQASPSPPARRSANRPVPTRIAQRLRDTHEHVLETLTLISLLGFIGVVRGNVEHRVLLVEDGGHQPLAAERRAFRGLRVSGQRLHPVLNGLARVEHRIVVVLGCHLRTARGRNQRVQAGHADALG